MQSESLKLVGASEAELNDPRVAAKLLEMEHNGEAAAARVICEGVPVPPASDIPVAVNQHGLARYGITLRRKTNIHDLFIQRAVAFGVPPSPRWVQEFKANPKTAKLRVPEKIIPETYMPSVFIFILGAPFATIEKALTAAESLLPTGGEGQDEGAGLFHFLEAVDAWIATTGIPTDKTEEVWQSITDSLKFLEELAAPLRAGACAPEAANSLTVKKRGRRGSSRTTR